MKKITILKGFHAPINDFPSISDGNCFDGIFIFTDSCVYDLKGDDQYDWNKLCGFSMGLLPRIFNGKLVKPMHYNSARFGWRWNLDKQCIEVGPYLYKYGVRMYPELNDFKTLDLKLNQEYRFTIQLSEYHAYLSNGKYKSVVFKIYEGYNCIYKQEVNFGMVGTNFNWNAVPIFGGSLKAPHKVQILKY